MVTYMTQNTDDVHILIPYCLVIITSWFLESCAVFPFQLHWMLDLFLSSHKLLLCLCLNVKPFLSANINISTIEFLRLYMAC